MSRDVLVNVSQPEECRVAVVEDGILDELYIERTNLQSCVNNVYKGKITGIEPSIQAAFVEFGGPKAGFLHISDVHPKYFAKDYQIEKVGQRLSMRKRPQIQKCLKRGQEIMIQVTRDGIEKKGPTVTTYISMPGRYLVLMPWLQGVGISQKVEENDDRKRLREIFGDEDLYRNCGLIVRTAAKDASKRDLRSDLRYVMRLWGSIQKKFKRVRAPAEIYQDSNLAIRTLRDIFNTKLTSIVCDSEEMGKKLMEFVSISQPRMKKIVSIYNDKVPLFHHNNIEDQIKTIHSNRVELPSGASIVIDQTEALVAIDVNTGKGSRHNNAETNIYKTNLEAAVEIARQLRLRDLGGLIICDFIDMSINKHRQEVEKVFRAAMKNDHAKLRILKMSAFGLIEITRQRMRPSIGRSTYYKCPYCKGTGNIKNDDLLGLELIRLLQLAGAKEETYRIEMLVSPGVADFLQNFKRTDISRIEQLCDKRIIIRSDENIVGENYIINCYDNRDRHLNLEF
jgi:ribonuclease E